MPVVNYASREITCKIVYYGPGRSGKTSNLQYIHRRVPEGRRGEPDAGCKLMWRNADSNAPIHLVANAEPHSWT